MTPFDRTTGEPDPFTDRDGMTVPEYEADPFPVSWDFLAIVVIAAACVAFIVWRWA